MSTEQRVTKQELYGGHTKDTHTGRIDTFNNSRPVTGRSDAVASANQNTRRSSERSALSKGRDDVAVDTDDFSAGSVVSKRHLSFGAPTEYKVPSGNTCRRYTSMTTGQHITDQDLYGVSPEGSQHYGATQRTLDARHRTVPQAGSLNEAKQHSYSTVHQLTLEPGDRLSGKANGKRQPIKSVDPKASSSQHHANRNQGFDDEDKDWPCARCTFLNPPDHRICAMCGASRGVGPLELLERTQAESRVCRNCTFYNKETARICRACHKTLIGLIEAETTV